MSSQSSGVSEASSRGTPSQWHNKDFKIVVDSVKTGSGSSATTGQISVHLLAPTMQEKAAWISDITQVRLCWMYEAALCVLLLSLVRNVSVCAVHGQRPLQRPPAHVHL